MYALQFKKSALKELGRLPSRRAAKLVQELEAVANSPATYRGDWKPLKASRFWRLRMGQYRAICELRKGRLVLLVLKIGPRGDVYK